MQATILDAASVSNILSLGPSIVIGLEIPAGFEGNAIGFNFGTDPAALAPVQSMGGTVLKATSIGATALYVSIDPRTYRLTQGYLQLVAYTTNTPQAQTGAISINVIDDARP